MVRMKGRFARRCGAISREYQSDGCGALVRWALLRLHLADRWQLFRREAEGIPLFARSKVAALGLCSLQPCEPHTGGYCRLWRTHERARKHSAQRNKDTYRVLLTLQRITIRLLKRISMGSSSQPSSGIVLHLEASLRHWTPVAAPATTTTTHWQLRRRSQSGLTRSE